VKWTPIVNREAGRRGEILFREKSVEKLLPIHEAQLLTYLKLGRLGYGLLLNFNSAVLRDGIRRMTLKDFSSRLPASLLEEVQNAADDR